MPGHSSRRSLAWNRQILMVALSSRATAIDRKQDAGDEARMVLREPKTRIGDVPSRAEAAKWDRCQKLRPVLGSVGTSQEILEQTGGAHHRADRVHPYIVRRELDRHALRDRV